MTGSKYSVVDRARTYTPTARRRAVAGRPVDSVFQVLSEEEIKLQKEDDKRPILQNEVDLPFTAKILQGALTDLRRAHRTHA